MKIIIFCFILATLTASVTFGRKCDADLKPEKLVVVGVWKRGFDNSTAQYRISDEDLSVRGYERTESDKGSSTVMLARHPEGCVINECGVRLSAMMQNNGAILHTDYRMIRMNDSTMNNIEDEFYCAEKNNFCGADVPIYRLVKHSLTGPHYAYTFNDVGQSLPGYEKEFFPLCFAWRQTPSVVLFNSTDDGVCLTLPEVQNGKILYSNDQLNVFSIGTSATLECHQGFAGNGPSSLVCTKNGWYPKREDLGSCVRLEQSNKSRLLVASDVTPTSSSCRVPSSTPNGNIVYSANVATSTSINSVPTATRATVLCSLGHVPTTSVTSSKCVDGEWEPSLPTCLSLLDIKCPILSAPRNGELVFTNSVKSPYSLNSVISLKCDRNYFGTGNLTSTCTSTGWDQKIGQCEPVGIRRLSESHRYRIRRQASTGAVCAAIANPANGNLLYMQSNPTVQYSSGTSAYLMCNLGYSLSGSVSTLCSNGVWSPSIGQCTNALALGQTTGNCEAIPTRINGTITYSSFGTYTSGTIATLACNLMNTVSGSSTSTCLSGVWNPTIGNCVSSGGTGGTGTTCPNPTVINGQITYNQGNTFDTTRPALTTATLTCNSGYTRNGNYISTCLGGVFTPTLGTCTFGTSGSTGTACINPIIMNGQITYSQGNTYDITRPSGTVATLTCNSGYTISGSSQSTCTNGAFSPTLGTCNFGSSTGGTGTTCPNPTVVNGQITYSQGNTFDATRPALTTATLTCNSGYTISGTSISACMNGVFTPTLGTCTFGSSGSAGTACMNPYVINGQITYSQGNTYDITRPAGTTATLTCSSGYTVSGTSVSTCTNGIFTPTLGTCTLGSSTGGTGIQCTAMIAPLGGSVIYSNGGTMGPFPSGTTVTGSCTNGGAITGASTATCSNGMWNPTFLGTCSLIGGSTTGQCSALTIPSGAQATYSPFSLSTTSFTSGTVATVTCTTGGSMLGTSTCTNGLWSPAIMGTCSGTGTGNTCSALTRPVGETVTYDGTTSFATTFNSGVIARVTCSNGTQIGQSTCLVGQWTPAITATCSGSSTAVGSQCIGVIVPTNAQVTYSDGSMVLHSAGTTATLTCLNSATLTGSSYSSCSNGVWTPTLGSCTSSGTGTGPCYTPPLTPVGATLTYSSGYFAPWTAGSTATMSCPAGQTVIGTSISYCTNSAWSPALGSCSGSSVGQASTTTTTCSFLPIAPPYGSIVTSQTAPFSAGTMVTLQCDNGYQIQGNNATSTCTNGVFSEITATCIKN
ncbi:Sushi domain-containing protein [Caenorhabditis elegans]|uniref:Sushi domain-containing protein n=1 Tax=Caenorhabditis elegans TaxID=6239 RepID=H2L2F2_CAEEL|nr:Sushi domain-containing protein [Caenorhabditis elegans]CCE72113.1 Sushi domain-containing protein [Caenorhabditis elegans]|eukprot:NP_001251042.1 Uncharacterized protein CELE_F36H2.3 [Caenorhabditis elegans]